MSGSDNKKQDDGEGSLSTFTGLEATHQLKDRDTNDATTGCCGTNLIRSLSNFFSKFMCCKKDEERNALKPEENSHGDSSDNNRPYQGGGYNTLDH